MRKSSRCAGAPQLRQLLRPAVAVPLQLRLALLIMPVTMTEARAMLMLAPAAEPSQAHGLPVLPAHTCRFKLVRAAVPAQALVDDPRLAGVAA